MRLRFLPSSILLCLAVLAPPAPAGEAHFVLVFGSERPFMQLRYAHSFATFVRVVGDLGRPDACYVEAFTISWLPQDGHIRPFALLPECGRNFGLEETLRLVQAEGERVAVWGPYQIVPELYQLALAQKTRLESGAVCYKAIDTGYATERVSNCIHALSDVVEGGPRLRVGTPGWGETASYF